jgi:hypothetical protein
VLSIVLKLSARERFFVAKQTLARLELCTNVGLLLLASSQTDAREYYSCMIKPRTFINTQHTNIRKKL